MKRNYIHTQKRSFTLERWVQKSRPATKTKKKVDERFKASSKFPPEKLEWGKQDGQLFRTTLQKKKKKINQFSK